MHRGLGGRVAVVGAAVLLLAGISACASKAGSDASSQVYDGHGWRVTEVKQLRSPTFDMKIPAAENVWIAFDGKGRLTANDPVEGYSVQYRRAPGGFIPSGYRGSAGWVATPERVDDAITSVIGDSFHPVRVTRTSARTIVLTAHYRGGGSGWHATTKLYCVREPSIPRLPVPASPTTSSPAPAK